ncbi:MAG: hypothetical protein ACYSU5_15565 [Planctomycetota bacterium]
MMVHPDTYSELQNVMKISLISVIVLFSAVVGTAAPNAAPSKAPSAAPSEAPSAVPSPFEKRAVPTPRNKIDKLVFDRLEQLARCLPPRRPEHSYRTRTGISAAT